MTVNRDTQIDQWTAEARALAAQLGETNLAQSLALEDAAAPAPRYRVGVFGEVNRGKSTIINALLGSETLPVASTPTTATITTIQAASAPSMTVIFPGVLEEERELDSASWDDLTNTAANTDYPLVTVRLDNPWLESLDGEIIDTPGLNAGTRSGFSTLDDVLASCQRVLLVMSATSVLSMTEKNWLKKPYIQARCVEVGVVLTHLDATDDDERTLRYARSQAETVLSGITVMPFYPPDDARGADALDALRQWVVAPDASALAGQRRRQRRYYLGHVAIPQMRQTATEQAQRDEQVANQAAATVQRQLVANRQARLRLDDILADLGLRQAQTQSEILAASRAVRESVANRLIAISRAQEQIADGWLGGTFSHAVRRELQRGADEVKAAFKRGAERDEQWLEGAWNSLQAISPLPSLVIERALAPEIKQAPIQHARLMSLPPMARPIALIVGVLSVITGALFFTRQKVIALAIAAIGSGGAFATDQWMKTQSREQHAEFEVVVKTTVDSAFATFDHEVMEALSAFYKRPREQLAALAREWDAEAARGGARSQQSSREQGGAALLARLNDLETAVRASLD